VRILIACEFSGIVRDAFRAAGHDAVSCDLLPSERPGPHVQADVLTVIDRGWDMMVAFPPCTALCNSGNRWYAGTGERRQALRLHPAAHGRPDPAVGHREPGRRDQQRDQAAGHDLAAVGVRCR
jgi:hypothetical protein